MPQSVLVRVQSRAPIRDKFYLVCAKAHFLLWGYICVMMLMLKNKLDLNATYCYNTGNFWRLNMNYYGNTISYGSVVAGVAVLPNTGNNSILRYVAVATIITGIILMILQIVVIWYKKHRG